MFKRAQSAAAESDFVDSNLFQEVQTSKPERHRGGFVDSSLDLRQGAEVIEFDTVPAELLDLFK